MTGPSGSQARSASCKFEVEERVTSLSRSRVRWRKPQFPLILPPRLGITTTEKLQGDTSETQPAERGLSTLT